MSTRRRFLQFTATFGSSLFAGNYADAANTYTAHSESQIKSTGGYLGISSGSLAKVDQRASINRNVPVVTTDVGDLAYEMDGDIKVFRLTAHVLKLQIAPQKTIDVWGFNGSAPGPTIQVTQGDKVRVVFKNELPEPSSMHWHGFEDQLANDGMPGISQEPVKPGQSFVYNFVIKQEGTFFYHSHMAMQEMAGMLGAFIMHPKTPYRPHCDKDFVLHLQEYQVLPNATTPDTMGMHWNWLLLNGRAGPAATPLIVRQGDRVRIRFVNLGMDHHPMHLHGHTFYVTGTEGGRIPESAWWPGNTVLVGVAQARNVEFIADNPGDWMLHCHLPHHMMNSMASQVGPMTRIAGTANKSRISAGDGLLPATALVADPEAASANGPLADSGLDAGMDGMMDEQMGKHPRLSMEQSRDLNAFAMDEEKMRGGRGEASPDAEDVPDFPQDAYMEGPMMNMDTLVEKPENLGLRQGWSQYMQGMMTFVRVLPPAQYDEVVAAMKQAGRARDPYMSLYAQPNSNGQRG